MENQSYFLVLVLTILFLILIFKQFSKASKSAPPSPPSLPIIGHLHLIKNPKHISLASLSSRYGPILSLRLGFKSLLLVSSPSAVEECFTKNDVVFANRPTSMAGDRVTYNYGAYAWSSYGPYWRVLRKLSVVELFSSNSLQISSKVREDEILQILRVLHKHTGKKVDLKNLIYIYSYNIVMRGMAGKRFVEAEDIGTEAGKESLKRIRGLFFPNVFLGMCDYFPVLRWIGFKGLEKEAKLIFKRRDEFLQHLVDEIRMQTHATAEKRKSNLIETLLPLQASEPDFFTDDVIKSILLVMLLAGTGTSAVTLERAMAKLVSHPHQLQKLRQEIDENIGHDHMINESDLPKLPYLRCIVNETLRLHPPSPLLLPHISSEECMVGGYKIPKGTILVVNAWAVQRDPKLWDEPDKFHPERFQAEEMQEKEAHYKFFPFGIGRRACPGAAMAMRRVSLAVGAFVQCFEWEKPPEIVDDDFKANPLEPVCCILRKQAAHLFTKD